MKPHFIDAPAHWAFMLINNDLPDENTQDVVDCGVWLLENELGKANFVSCSEEAFWDRFDGLQCEMLTYTYFLRDPS